MDNIITISRPYATAVFDFAREQENQEQALNYWENVLFALKEIIKTTELQNLITQYPDNQHEICRVVTSFLHDEFAKDQHVNNFLATVEEHSRFAYLEGIYDFFVKLRQNYDLPTPVTIVSALDLTEEQKKKIGTFVATKIGRTVKLDIQVNPSILSGIVIKTDDFTLDCSGRNSLKKLSSQLTK